jgi:hypothetical protein
MNSNFVNQGVRYSLLVTARSRREVEEAATDIRPDYSLWTTETRRRAGIGIRGDGGKAWRNMHSTGARPTDTGDLLEAPLPKKRAWNKLDRAYVQVRAVDPKEFTDQVEFR